MNNDDEPTAGGRIHRRSLDLPPRTTRRDVERTRKPPVDWTGIQFKAISELNGPDYNHRGRLSIRGGEREK